MKSLYLYSMLHETKSHYVACLCKMKHVSLLKTCRRPREIVTLQCLKFLITFFCSYNCIFSTLFYSLSLPCIFPHLPLMTVIAYLSGIIFLYCHMSVPFHVYFTTIYALPLKILIFQCPSFFKL